MKQLLLLVVFLSFFSAAYNQQTDTTLFKETLLRKSKTQKIVGWILTGTGIPFVAGSVYSMVSFTRNDIDKGTVAAVLVASSLYSFIGILHLRASRKNKERALSLGLNTTRVLLPSPGRLKYPRQPVISLCLSLP